MLECDFYTCDEYNICKTTRYDIYNYMLLFLYMIPQWSTQIYIMHMIIEQRLSV